MTASTTLQFLVFLLDERSYGIRLSQSERVVRAVDCTPLPEGPANVLGVIDLHGQIVPLFNMRKRLGLAEREIGVNDHFIIARTLGRTVALMVDSVTGIVDRGADEITAIGDVVSDSDQIEGVVILDDGMMLIHDLDRFLSAEENRTLQSALTEQARHGS